MFVASVLAKERRRLVTIRTSDLLTEAAELLSSAGMNLVVVYASHGTMVGVITKTDIVLRHVSHCHGTVCTAKAAAVMRRNVIHWTGDDLLHDVWLMMQERSLLHVPIVDGESRPRGVLNARDALQALLEEVEDEESLLRDYVMGVGYR